MWKIIKQSRSCCPDSRDADILNFIKQKRDSVNKGGGFMRTPSIEIAPFQRSLETDGVRLANAAVEQNKCRLSV